MVTGWPSPRPPGRPRRFDARFFVIDAENLHGDRNDFSRASDELSHLHWVALGEARRLNLPFITEVVLAEVQALLDESSTSQPRRATAGLDAQRTAMLLAVGGMALCLVSLFVATRPSAP